MQAAEIRRKYLEFFEAKEHLVVPSSSLIPPPDDPTLLLTSAGMVQFKPYFLGHATPPHTRLTSSQKCFRVSDVEEVGDESHLTFFEMLGNFSIGDYFKKEAIAWAWGFVTERMGLPPERLWATVYLDDDEAHDLWVGTGTPSGRIRRFGKEDNFWGPPGAEGPCGPCSEIHYDFGGDCRLGKPLGTSPIGSQDTCGPNCDCGRFLELWNLVFMQFYQDAEGNQTPLPAPNIDTGMGLERAAVILQDVPSIYESDLFQPIVDTVAKLAGKTYGDDRDMDRAIRVVAEHTRSATFLIGDGVVPGNEGRGYVLRRLIRRAVLHGHKIDLRGSSSTARAQDLAPLQAFLPHIARVVIDHMGDVYPELVNGQQFILRVLEQEEERFNRVLGTGLGLLDIFTEPRLRIDEVYRRLDKEFGRTPPSSREGIRAAAARIHTDTTTVRAKLAMGSSAFENVVQGFSGGQSRAGTDADSPFVLASKSFVASGLEGVIETAYALKGAQSTDKPESAIAELWCEFANAVNSFKQISGDEAFILHDTYGFPVEVTSEIAAEHGLSVDMEGFEREMEAQRERARAASGFGGDWDALRRYQELDAGDVRFLGYETTSTRSEVLALLVGSERAGVASEGQRAELVLRETPFYAEGGGQVGDTGVIEGENGTFQVEDTQSPVPGLIVHRGRVSRGSISHGETVTASVDVERRRDAGRNHTATHLLHAALRTVLGSHVRQQGSLVTPDRLRFDFTHVSPMTPAEIHQVEAIVNGRIRANVPVHKRETTYRQAVDEGALAFFGERYGDSVRVIEIPDVRATGRSPAGERPTDDHVGAQGLAPDGAPFSMEICGGTHVERTGDLGYCHVVGESSVGAGLRRIEAVTGRAAEAMVREQEALLRGLSQRLETSPGDLPSRVDALLEETGRLRRVVAERERAASREQAQSLLENVQDVDGLKMVTGRASATSVDTVREMGDWLRDKLGSGVVSLGAVVNNRPVILVMATKEAVARGAHAGNTVREAAKVMGGGGGGRPDMAQGGGRDSGKLDEALRVARKLLTHQLTGRE